MPTVMIVTKHWASGSIRLTFPDQKNRLIFISLLFAYLDTACSVGNSMTIRNVNDFCRDMLLQNASYRHG